MAKNRLKLGLWALVGLLLAAGAGAVLLGLGELIVDLREGADPALALNSVPDALAEGNVALRWLPDDADTGRVMEPFTRRQIASAYLNAWRQWNLSYARGEPYGLQTYFVGPALAGVTEGVQQAAAQGLQIEQVNLDHPLQLHFYAADGSIVAFTDTAVRVRRSVRSAAGQTLYAGETTASYRVVMFLEDGNWRVRHWVRGEE